MHNFGISTVNTVEIGEITKEKHGTVAFVSKSTAFM